MEVVDSELIAHAASAASHGQLDRLLGDRSWLQHVPYVVCVTDRTHRLLYINRTVPGRRAEEFVGTSVFDSVPEHERANMQAALELAWTTGEPQRYKVRTLSHFSYECSVVPIKEHARTAFLFITSLDVTQRVMAEEALRESEARLRQTLEATGVGMFDLDAKADVLTWDAALCRIWGGEAGAAPSNHAEYLAVVHPEDRERVAAAYHRGLASGAFEDIEHRLLQPQGHVRHVLSKAIPTRDTKGELVGFRGLTFDITERKRLEEQLRHAQKMEAVGQLTAGIAHNFNNLLGVILPNIELCMQEADEENKLRLGDAEHAAARAAELVQQLMLFARADRRAHKQPLCMLELCRRTADICRKTFHASIAVKVEGDADEAGLRVRGDAAQLEQVILNVCLNARDAMLAAQTAWPHIHIRVQRGQDGCVHISVEDNGPGMDDATAARVFEPFFTTKAAGRGTGLGLASAYAVIRDHGGDMRCEGRLGRGAHFEIRMPPCVDDPQPTAAATAMLAAASGRGAILLVDDEPMVRRALRGLLERAGYVVLEAGSGEEGLSMIERHSTRIAAVLLDQSMPGLRGSQVVGALRERGYTLPIVLLSGEPLGPDERVSAVLTKPLRAGELLGALARVLGDTRSPEA